MPCDIYIYRYIAKNKATESAIYLRLSPLAQCYLFPIVIHTGHHPVEKTPPPTSWQWTRSDSAITKHLKENRTCLQQGITDSFRILAWARHHRHLEILEAAFIQSFTPSLCQQKDVSKYLLLGTWSCTWSLSLSLPLSRLCSLFSPFHTLLYVSSHYTIVTFATCLS